MDKLRERLAAFQGEAEKIFDALGDREWPAGKVEKRVNLLRGDLDDVIRDLAHLIDEEEAWEEK